MQVSGLETLIRKSCRAGYLSGTTVADDLEAFIATEVPCLIRIELIQLHEQRVTAGHMDRFAVEALVDGPDMGLSPVVREPGDAGNEICGRRPVRRKGKCTVAGA